MIERHQVDGEYLCRGATGQPPDEIIKNLNSKDLSDLVTDQRRVGSIVGGENLKLLS